jgi:predicted MFS family arabinose efflux permease
MKPERSVDSVGASLVFITLLAFSFVLIRGPSGWQQSDVLVGLTVAAVAAWAFLRREQRADDPLLPLELFRSQVFSGGNSVTLLSFMVSAGVFLFVAVQLQTTLGYQPSRAGAALVPIYVIMLIGSPISGRMADRIGLRTLPSPATVSSPQAPGG